MGIVNDKKLIKVSALSFGKNVVLRQRLMKYFPNCEFFLGERDGSEEELIHFYKGANAILVGTENVSREVLRVHPQIEFLSKIHTGYAPGGSQGHFTNHLPGIYPGGVFNLAGFIQVQNKIIVIQDLSRRFSKHHKTPGGH